jgi:DNA-binding SARP family transcriptional activator/tetratricopeptide (TPR) repeat protein/DNA-binding XRE family transcriptional regulator
MNSSSMGELLRHYRFRAGLRQDELASKAEVSVRALRYIEQGRVGRPHASSVRRLADALGLTAADLDALLRAPTTAGEQPPATGLRIAVLGPLALHHDGEPVEIGSAMLRTLLGLLAVQPRQVVSGEEIIDVLWGAEPPRTCLALVHTYVGQLRRLLEPGRAPSAPTRVLRHSRTGYRLDLDAARLDLTTFTELVGQARGAGDPRRSWDLFNQAAAVWRGPVLADAGDRLRQHPAVVAITGRRIAMAVDHADLGLELGLGDRLVGPLQALFADEPLHEGLATRLMLALAEDGQQAAALALFASMRDRLDAELGVQPGTELRTAQLRVLRGADESPAATRPAVPAQLPVDPASFVGREDHLRELDSALPAGGGESGRVVAFTTVAGMGGVGKTALAVRWSHRVRDRFPDGQLYVNLRGHATAPPLRPIDALAGFLLAFGTPADRIPDDVEQAAALYRSELAGRRVLVLLDNVASAEQVRPLLPTGPGSLALITSRYRMAGLVAREGARELAVDVLRPDEALALLSQMIGADRVAAEPAETAELARLCAYLPLALRIAAANLAGRPRHRIGDQVARLAAGDRLTALAIDGDAETAVRATFDLSYDALAAPERQVFRLLGLLAGTEVTAGAVAALAGINRAATDQALDRLTARHLVEETSPGRYGMHDLLRLYAAELSAAHDDPDQRTAATRRLAVHYLDLVSAAAEVSYPHVLKLPDQPPPPAGHPHFGTVEAAMGTLDAERPNLVVLLPLFVAEGHHALAWRLGEAMLGYFRRRMNAVDWQVVADTTLAAARADGNLNGQAAAELSLGSLCDFQSRFEDAAGHYNASLELARLAAWTDCQAVALNNLARTFWTSGRPHETIDHLHQALALHRKTGRRAGEAVTLANLGVAHWEVGRTSADPAGLLDQALTYLNQALALHREIGDRHNEADTLRALATTQRDAGNLTAALRLAEEALTLAREAGDIRFTSLAHNTLATVQSRLGQADSALGHHQQALAIARDAGDGHLETQILIDLAETNALLGQREDALRQARRARAIAQRIGSGQLDRKAQAVIDAPVRAEPLVGSRPSSGH